MAIVFYELKLVIIVSNVFPFIMLHTVQFRHIKILNDV